MLEIGDYVYYNSQEGDTVPTGVLKVYPKCGRIKIKNFYNKIVIVKMSKCKLQKEEK